MNKSQYQTINLPKKESFVCKWIRKKHTERGKLQCYNSSVFYKTGEPFSMKLVAEYNGSKLQKDKESNKIRCLLR